MKKLFYEEVLQRRGDQVVASNIREATPKEIAEARRLHKNGKCPHTIVVDTSGWDFDMRDCAICGKGLGLV